MSGRNGWEDNTWFTARDVLDVARVLLTTIDLDPASSAAANTVVKAKVFYTESENGFDRPWSGRVFCNPPGGRVDPATGELMPKEQGNSVGVNGPAAWWHQGARRWLAGEIEEFFFYGFNIEVLHHAQAERTITRLAACAPGADYLLPTDTIVIHPDHRLRNQHLDASGKVVEAKSGTNASMLAWLPPRTMDFAVACNMASNATIGFGQVQVPALQMTPADRLWWWHRLVKRYPAR